MKERLIKELKKKIINAIKEKIENDYPFYLNYLINSIKNISPIINNVSNIVITLNNKDFNYFNKNFKEIQKIFKNQIGITQNSTDFLGGFKVISANEEIIYDYTINNLIEKNSAMIEIEFSKIFDASKIKEIQDNFIQFIRYKKNNIKEHLKEYATI